MASLDPAAFFGFPAAFWGLSLLVPVVVLYLLKPKPKLVKFPSTMFIKFMEKSKRFTSFLQKFIRDPILLMQLLIISFIILALANPFTNLTEQQKEEQSVVIVIDGSASMQSTDVSPTRMDSAVGTARRILSDLSESDDVSIVLAESIPVTLLSRGTIKSAEGVFGKLKASDTPTNIGDSMMLARDILSGSKKKRVIYVLSDFMNAQGLDPLIARKVASVEGISVSFVRTCSDEAQNVGIVSFNARRSLVNESKLILTASVKSYAGRDANVKMKFISEGQVLKNQSFVVKAGGEEFLYSEIDVSNNEQVGRLELSTGDDLEVDDVAYVYIPAVRTYNVLLLTSDNPDTDKYLKLMLSSLRSIQVTIAVPPVTPKFDGFDVIVLGSVKKDSILPGTFRDVKSRVDSGASFIITASSDVPALTESDFWSMLPLYPGEVMNEETNIEVRQEHDMLSNVILDNVVLKKYLKVNATVGGAKVLASTTGEHPTPVMAYREFGRGYVMVMNINTNPEWSNFYYSSSFPILWSQMMKYFNQPRDSEGVKNKLSGEYLQLPEERVVETPGGEVKSSTLFLDKTGVYGVRYDNRVDYITVNLLNGFESNLSCVDVRDSVDEQDFSSKKDEVEVRREHYTKILLVVLAFILIETIVYRRRGLL